MNVLMAPVDSAWPKEDIMRAGYSRTPALASPALAWLCALLLFGVSCGGGSVSPTAPSSGSSSGTTQVAMHFSVGLGGLTAQFQGTSLRVDQPAVFRLGPGEYELSGQMTALGTTGGMFSVVFTKSAQFGVVGMEPGGVDINSVRSVAGPATGLTQCGQIYSFDGTGSREWRLRFRVTLSGTIGSYCP